MKLLRATLLDPGQARWCHCFNRTYGEWTWNPHHLVQKSQQARVANLL